MLASGLSGWPPVIDEGGNCSECGGAGVRAPATPSCPIADLGDGWIVVERCDQCELYDHDLDAAFSLFDEARWVTCESGGDHAIARAPSPSMIEHGHDHSSERRD